MPPVLEHDNSVLDSQYGVLQKELENAQKRAARFIIMKLDV